MSTFNIDTILNYMNNSKIFTGMMMICLNIGSKYISIDFTKNHTTFFNSVYFRRLVVFTIVFVATKDIKVSILLTLVYILMFSYLFHGKSSLCILPPHIANLDLNDDGVVSAEEIEIAYNTLKKAGKLPNKNITGEMIG